MTIEQFWAELAKHGFTKYRLSEQDEDGGERIVILQSRNGGFPSITDPHDLPFEKRPGALMAFLNRETL